MPRTTGDAGSSAGSDTYGPVQKGETLRKIAEQVKPSNVSMEQMLVSLYRQNQQAFVGNNMNRLRTGQILKVPTADEVGSVEQKEANREIRTAEAEFGDAGRILVRFSGTEPLARVMVEGPELKRVEHFAHSIAAAIQAELG